MKTIKLGKSSLSSSRLCYGCWRIAGTRDQFKNAAAAEASGRAALLPLTNPATLFDGADIYGGGQAEVILGQTLRVVSGMRNAFSSPTSAACVMRARRIRTRRSVGIFRRVS